ncbi:MAG: hypothetical protein II822_02505 [Prevotella sp.]|nr:hypothetical protein [Prevotella sp.]
MKYLLTLISTLLLFASCSKEEEKNSSIAQRTVVVYMSGENNLTSIAQDDIDEMIAGANSLADGQQLVIFVDRASTTEKPFLARLDKNATATKIDTLYRFQVDFYASSADEFYNVLKKATTLCPAKEYGLVLWGHASGWVIEQDSIPTNVGRRAYGVDNGSNSSSVSGKWMNIPSMRMALEALGIKWQFIFADCCNMMCAEVGYELRNVTQYLIGSSAEIPGWGAPYDSVVPELFRSGSALYKGIIDKYYDYYLDYFSTHPTISVSGVGTEELGGYSVPLAVIETKNMEALAQSTKDIVTYIANENPTEYPEALNLNHLPYYLNIDAPMMYDMKAFVKHFASISAYSTWLDSYQKAVPYARSSAKWMTIFPNLYPAFAAFDQNADWGCVSMFVPQNQPAYVGGNYKYNQNATHFLWSYIIDWSRFGW